MTPLRSLVVLASSLIATTPCLGQVIQPKNLLWPVGAEYGTGGFRDATAGFLTAERIPHAVIQRGSKGVFLYEPAAYHSLTPLGVTLISLDRFAGEGIDQDHDALVVSTAGGVHRLWIDGSPPAFQSAPIPGAAWPGSLIVRSANLDGDAAGLADLAGVDSTGTIVWTKVQDGAGGFLDDSFAPGFPVLSLELLRFLPGNAYAIAVCTSDGLKVYTLGGTPLADYRCIDSSADVLAVLPEAGWDRLAWVTAGLSGNRLLLIVDHLGYEGPLSVNQWGIVNASGGDVDGDGDADLFLAQDTDHKVPLLINQTVAPTVANPAMCFSLDPAGFVELDPGNPGQPIPGNNARPLLMDFDQNGYLDLVYAVSTMNKAAMFEGPLLGPPEGLLPGTNDFDTETPALVQQNPASCGEVDVELNVIFQDYGECQNPNRFEVVTWFAQDYQQGIDPHDAEHHTLFPCDGGAGSQPIHFRFDMGTGDWDANPFLVYLYVRPVQWVNEHIVSAGPPLIGGFAVDADAKASILVHPTWLGLGEWPISLSQCSNLEFGSRLGGFYRGRFAVGPEGLIPELSQPDDEGN